MWECGDPLSNYASGSLLQSYEQYVDVNIPGIPKWNYQFVEELKDWSILTRNNVTKISGCLLSRFLRRNNDHRWSPNL